MAAQHRAEPVFTRPARARADVVFENRAGVALGQRQSLRVIRLQSVQGGQPFTGGLARQWHGLHPGLLVQGGQVLQLSARLVGCQAVPSGACVQTNHHAGDRLRAGTHHQVLQPTAGELVRACAQNLFGGGVAQQFGRAVFKVQHPTLLIAPPFVGIQVATELPPVAQVNVHCGGGPRQGVLCAQALGARAQFVKLGLQRVYGDVAKAGQRQHSAGVQTRGRSAGAVQQCGQGLMPLQRVQFKRFFAVEVCFGCVEMDAQAVLVIHRQGLSEHAMPARQGVVGGGALTG